MISDDWFKKKNWGPQLRSDPSECVYVIKLLMEEGDVIQSLIGGKVI